MIEREIFNQELTIEIEKIINSEGYRALLSDAKNSSELKNYFTVGKLVKILNLSNPISTLDVSECYLIVRFLTGKDRIAKKFLEYFTQEEISNSVSIENLTDTRADLNIKSIFKGNSENPEWIGVMTFKEIRDAYKSGKLIYDTNVQRAPKIESKNGMFYMMPDISESNVSAIKKNILSGEFESNTITLNIMQYDYVFTDYDPNDNSMVVDTQKYSVAIIDGMHRILAIVRALDEQPEIQGTMSVCIKNLTEDGCRKFIYQESLANLYLKKTIDKYDPDNKMNILIRGLNNTGTKSSNYFYKNIKTSSNFYNNNELIWEENLMYALNLTKIKTTFQNCRLSYVKQFENFISQFFTLSMEELKEKIEDADSILENQIFIIGLVVTSVHYFYKNKGEIDIKDIFNLVSNVESKYDDLLNYDIPLKNKEKMSFIELYEGLMD